MSIAVVLQQRFFDCVLEVSPEQTRFGVKAGQRQGQQPDTKRTLLAIEQQAQQMRQAGMVAKQQFLEFTQAHLHDQVAEELFLKLGRFETIASTVFSLAEGFPQVLDTLSTRAVTLSQLEALILLLAAQLIHAAAQVHGGDRIVEGETRGELAVGMQADLALFKLDELRFSGSHDPVSALLLCGADTCSARAMNCAASLLMGGNTSSTSSNSSAECAVPLRNTCAICSER